MLLIWLAVAAALPQDTASVKSLLGEVRVRSSGAVEERAIRQESGSVEVALPGAIVVPRGCEAEVRLHDAQLRLVGPAEGSFARLGPETVVSLASAAWFRLEAKRSPLLVALGTRDAVVARGCTVEGRFLPEGESVLANVAGEPVSLLRDGSPVERLNPGDRTRVPATRPGAPAPTGEARTLPWVGKTLEMPPGVTSRVEGLTLVVECPPGGAPAVVRYGDRFFFLPSRGGLVLGPEGKPVELRGGAASLGPEEPVERTFRLPSDPGATPVRVPSGPLSVRLLEAETLAPLGAELALLDAETGRVVERRTASKDGLAEFEPAGPGPYRLQVGATWLDLLLEGPPTADRSTLTLVLPAAIAEGREPEPAAWSWWSAETGEAIALYGGGTLATVGLVVLLANAVGNGGGSGGSSVSPSGP